MPELFGELLVPVMPLFPMPMTSATIVLAVLDKRSWPSGRVIQPTPNSPVPVVPVE